METCFVSCVEGLHSGQEHCGFGEEDERVDLLGWMVYQYVFVVGELSTFDWNPFLWRLSVQRCSVHEWGTHP